MSDKEFGTFLCLRFDATQLKELELYLKETNDPHKMDGRVEALTDKINYVEGLKWVANKGLCIMYFSTHKNAINWWDAATDLQDSSILGDIDAVVVDLIATPPGNDRTAFSFATLKLFDEEKFFTQYCPKWGPQFKQYGACLGASGRKVTREWKMLQGEWIPKDHLLLVNYLYDVPIAMDFYLSESYDQPRRERNEIGKIDIYITERRVDLFKDS